MKEVIKANSGKRVSKSSAKELSTDLESKGKEISQKALEIAEEKGRVTIRAEDIREAIRDK